MIVECAKCGSRFRLDEQKIGTRGARVRCAKCQHSFVVQRPEPGLELDTEPPLGAPVPSPAASPPPAAAEPPPFPAPTSGPRTHPGTPSKLPAAPYAAPPVFLTDDETRPSTGDPFGVETTEFQEDVSGHSVHELQTAVYTIPAEIRAAAQRAMAQEAEPPPVSDRAAASSPFDVEAVLPPGLGPRPGDATAQSADDVELLDASDAVIEVAELELREESSSPLVMAGGLGLDGTFFPPDAPEAAAQDPEPAFDVATLAGRPADPPAGNDAAPSSPLATVPRAEPARAPASMAVKAALSLVALVVLGFGVLLYLGGGRLDLSLVGLAQPGAAARANAAEAYQGVVPVVMRSVLYPTQSGDALVFAGTAENRSGAPQGPVDVIAELKDESGNVVATAHAPLGVVLSPLLLAGLSDADSLEAAYLSVVREHGQQPLPAGATAAFTVVMLGAPDRLEALQHQVRLAAGRLIEPPPPPEPEPEPAVVEPPPEPPSKLKRKGRLKGKRPWKAKRKAKLD